MGVEGLTGKVQTVLERIAPDELGVTLPHEHIITDVTCQFVEPEEATAKAMAHRPSWSGVIQNLRINLQRIRFYPADYPLPYIMIHLLLS